VYFIEKSISQKLEESAWVHHVRTEKLVPLAPGLLIELNWVADRCMLAAAAAAGVAVAVAASRCSSTEAGFT